MSLLPQCTCDGFGWGIGTYSDSCPRHWQMAQWWKEKAAEREAHLRNLRVQAKNRPVHGGYPDAPPARPSRDWYERMIGETLEAEDAAGGVLAAGALGTREDCKC